MREKQFFTTAKIAESYVRVARERWKINFHSYTRMDFPRQINVWKNYGKKSSPGRDVIIKSRWHKIGMSRYAAAKLLAIKHPLRMMTNFYESSFAAVVVVVESSNKSKKGRKLLPRIFRRSERKNLTVNPTDRRTTTTTKMNSFLLASFLHF